MEYYFTGKENVRVNENELSIGDFEFRHIVKVLRRQRGDLIEVTDGERNIYECQISEIRKNEIVCKILKQKFNLYEPVINLTLCISPLRNPARFEFAVEKAVELGVNTVQPIITRFTINKNFFTIPKAERLKKIIIGAMGQSQRCYLPELKNAATLEEVVRNSEQLKNKIVMYEVFQKHSAIAIDKNSRDVLLMIGPEGGFSSDEINLLKENDWQTASLGERKLRAETAAIVAVHEMIKKFN